VILDRPRADEQPGGDLRVGQAVPGHPRHLSLPGRQRRPGPGRSWGGLDGPVGHGLTRVAQLTAGPLGERLDPDRLQHVVRRAKLLTRLVAAALAAQPLPVQQVSAGEHRTHAGPAQPGDRLAIQAVGDFALGQQRRDRVSIPSPQSVQPARVHSATRPRASPATPGFLVRAAASISSGRAHKEIGKFPVSAACRAAASASWSRPRPIYRLAAAQCAHVTAAPCPAAVACSMVARISGAASASRPRNAASHSAA
jgi:hypothetical protein